MKEQESHREEDSVMCDITPDNFSVYKKWR